VRIQSLLTPILNQAEHGGAVKGEASKVDIIGHVSNGEHPLFHIDKIFGIDFSITKHVLMLWIVAAILFVTVTWLVRRYIRQSPDRLVPRGSMNALEAMVEFIRDAIVLPNVGQKWVRVWTPLLLTLFLGIVGILDNVLKPLVMGRGLTTPTLVIFVGVIGGTLVHGLVGLFIGPIILSLAWELTVAWIRADHTSASALPTGER